MAFEVYIRRRRNKQDQKPMVSVGARGILGLNAAARELLGADCHFVHFFVDRERKIIALRSAAKDSLHSYPVRKQPKSESYLVSGYGVLKSIGHTGREPIRRFPLHRLEADFVGFCLADV